MMKKSLVVFVFVFVSVFVLTSGMAVKSFADPLKGVKPYFSVQANIGYIGQSKERGYAGEKDTDLAYSLTDAVFGLEVEREKLTGKFELKIADNNLAEIGEAVAEYDFGFFSLLMGLTDLPYTFKSGEASFEANNLAGFGATDEDANLMTKLKVNGVYLTIVKPNLPENDNGDREIAGQVVGDYDVMLPKIVIGYDLETKMIKAGFGAGYNTFKIVDQTHALDGTSVNSYIIYAHAELEIGNFLALINFDYANNPSELGLGQAVEAGSVYDAAEEELVDTTTLEGFLELGYKYDPVTLKIGLGYVQSDNDNFEEKDKAMAYYIQLAYSLNQYITVIPEFSMHDYMKDNTGAEEGTEFNAGVFIEIAY